jgi:hypothetical protein
MIRASAGGQPIPVRRFARTAARAFGFGVASPSAARIRAASFAGMGRHAHAC